MQLELFPNLRVQSKPTRKVPRIVTVDFDGTIVDHEFPSIGKIKPGAKEALARLRELGYLIIIYSCRNSSFLADIFGKGGVHSLHYQDMVKFLDDSGIPYDEVDDGTKGKPFADFMIDDRGMHYDNNWPEVVRFIEERT